MISEDGAMVTMVFTKYDTPPNSINVPQFGEVKAVTLSDDMVFISAAMLDEPSETYYPRKIETLLEGVRISHYAQ